MGMDVFGVAADDPAGEYFRANVWYWRPLWDYIEDNHGVIAHLVENPYTNDGDGLDHQYSLVLARQLRHDFANDVVAEYEQRYLAGVNALQSEECWICHGTGVRREWPPEIPQEHIDACNGCNCCNGSGKTEPLEASYRFSPKLLLRFTEFLEHCGGFRIH